jgi:hypothetical protein
MQLLCWDFGFHDQIKVHAWFEFNLSDPNRRLHACIFDLGWSSGYMIYTSPNLRSKIYSVAHIIQPIKLVFEIDLLVIKKNSDIQIRM